MRKKKSSEPQSLIGDSGIVEKKNYFGPIFMTICYTLSTCLIIIGILAYVFAV